MRSAAVLLTLLVTLTAAPMALAQTASEGAVGADAQGTNASTSAGPAVPGPELIEPITGIDHPGRSARVIADSQGHLLVQGSQDGVQKLVALEPDDGSVDWVLGDVGQSCRPVATDDGRIFAQLVPRSETAGEDNSSADVVEIDAATGQITNRYSSPDTDAEPRLGECFDGLRVGADGIVLIYQSSRFERHLVAIDTTTDPMSLAWRHQPEDNAGNGGNGRIVLSPDGAEAFLTIKVADTSPTEVAVERIDVATGDTLVTQVVPGSRIVDEGLLHTGDLLVAQTTATGGHDDPVRLMGLDPATLDQQWLLESDEGEPIRVGGKMTLAGGNVVVHDSGNVVGIDATDGTVRWTHDASSFSNNGSQIVSDGVGRVYLSTFGGRPLEVLDGATGSIVFLSQETEDFLGTDVRGEAATLGPVLDDGRLYAIHRQDSEDVPLLVAYGNGSVRMDGISGEPIDVAIQICQYLFGDDDARTIVLSRDDVFADTLAGAPLSGDHSCILFTAGGPEQPLDSETRSEIRRALPDGGTVRILGGTQAVSSEAADTLSADGFTVERLSGAGRLQTAIEIARVVAAENPQADSDAVLAFSNDWPDAVTAGAAAAARGIPVLLTGTDALAQPTADALGELGITRTFVAGGTAVISDQAASAAPGPARIAGPNRYGTAAEVTRQLWAARAEENAFVLANLEAGIGWQLALAASPISVRLDAPQLGVRTDSVPPESSSYLTDAGVANPGLLVLGDVTVIADSVVDEVRS